MPRHACTPPARRPLHQQTTDVDTHGLIGQGPASWWWVGGHHTKSNPPSSSAAPKAHLCAPPAAGVWGLPCAGQPQGLPRTVAVAGWTLPVTPGPARSGSLMGGSKRTGPTATGTRSTGSPGQLPGQGCHRRRLRRLRCGQPQRSRAQAAPGPTPHTEWRLHRLLRTGLLLQVVHPPPPQRPWG